MDAPAELPVAHGVQRWFSRATSSQCPSCAGGGTETSDTGYTVDCGTCQGSGRLTERKIARAPWSDEDRAFFVQQGERMTRAEAHACDLLQRLVAWETDLVIQVRGMPRPEPEVAHVTWTRATSTAAEWAVRLRQIASATGAGHLALPMGACAHVARALRGVLGEIEVGPEVLGDLEARRAGFDEAARRGLVVPERWQTYDFPRTVVGKPFAELPNPFLPLIEIWQSGAMVTRTGSDRSVDLTAFASAP